MSNATYELWCLVRGDNTPFPVVTSPTSSIGALKQYIKKEREYTLFKRVDAYRLDLWQVDVDFDGIAGDIKEGKYHFDTDDKEPLVPYKKNSQIWPQPPEGQLHIYVTSRSILGSPTLVQMPKQESVLNSVLIREYQQIFIVTKDWGVFHYSDLARNNIQSMELAPEFVTNFERELERRPGVEPHVRPGFNWINDDRIWAAYHGPSTDSTNIDMENPNEGEEQPLRRAKLIEGTHIITLVSVKWERLWRGSPLNKRLMNEMFFRSIANSFMQEMHKSLLTVHLWKAPWPFSLVTKCANPQSTELRRYRPCSDFIVSNARLPRLLVEVNSTPKAWPQDLIRMLLQGASIVRLANTFLDTFEAKNFVLVAIFVRFNGIATRYSLFQRQSHRTVYYKSKDFHLDTPGGRVEFARQIYNMIHGPGTDEDVSDTEDKIEQLSQNIEDHDRNFGMKSFYTKKNDQEQSRKHPSDGAGAGGSADGVARGASAAYCAELRAHDYEVQPEVIVNASGIAFESLFKLPSHVLTVFRPSNPGEKLIAKKVRKGSNELMILKFLNTTQARHVVPLLDSFHTQSGLWIIIPKMDTITNYLRIAPMQLSGKVNQLCEGLIEGLGHLHRLGIAHRDIKPDNLLVDRTFCLKMIDFDIALEVEGEDEEVHDQCGTENWMAPEVEKNSMYSPIKADRWSCGRVILYLLDEFKNEDKHFRPFANKLTAHDPNRRPSLFEWASYATLLDATTVSNAANVSNVANVSDTGERKAFQSLQVSSRENTPLPEVKKRRLT